MNVYPASSIAPNRKEGDHSIIPKLPKIKTMNSSDKSNDRHTVVGLWCLCHHGDTIINPTVSITHTALVMTHKLRFLVLNFNYSIAYLFYFYFCTTPHVVIFVMFPFILYLFSFNEAWPMCNLFRIFVNTVILRNIEHNVVKVLWVLIRAVN